jgi:hypothetical protein
MNGNSLAAALYQARADWMAALKAVRTRFGNVVPVAIIEGFLVQERGMPPEQASRVRLAELPLLLSHRPAPRWDEDSRSLWLGRHLLKQFKQPAEWQTRLLKDFAEKNWPERIGNPLPLRDNHAIDRVLLKDTVRKLNGGLRGLRFALDGTGEGVRWLIHWDELF